MQSRGMPPRWRAANAVLLAYAIRFARPGRARIADKHTQLAFLNKGKPASNS